MVKMIKNILLSIASGLIFLVIIEFSCQVYLDNFADEQEFNTYATFSQISKKNKAVMIHTPHRYLGYYTTPNFKKKMNKHNSLGYKGDEIVQPKPDDEFRIVCMGGSTTYGIMNDYKLAYPYLLEKELQNRGFKKVRVVNAGVISWSSWETLINFLFRVLDLNPDMIIIYHAINDIHPRLVWPPGAYKGDNSGWRTVTDSDLLMPSIFEYSVLYRFFMIRAGLMQPQIALTRTIGKQSENYFGDLFMQQGISGSYPSGIFTKTSAKQMLKTNKPVYFKRNLENIIAVAKFRKIKTVLATFAYSPFFRKLPRASSEEYISAFNEMNNTLKTIAKEMDVNLFDFASAFPKNKKYFIDGRHVKNRGAVLKAELFARYIIENNLIHNMK